MWNGALLECAKSEQETVPCSFIYNTKLRAIAQWDRMLHESRSASILVAGRAAPGSPHCGRSDLGAGLPAA